MLPSGFVPSNTLTLLSATAVPLSVRRLASVILSPVMLVSGENEVIAGAAMLAWLVVVPVPDGEAVWADDLLQFTSDLPGAFQIAPKREFVAMAGPRGFLLTVTSV